MLTRYVTDAQLAQRFPEGDMDELRRRADRAARQARVATRGAMYPTFIGGEPTGSGVLGVFQDAVLEQLRYWDVNDIDPEAPAAAEPVVASRSLADRSVSYDNTAAAAQQAQQTASRDALVPDALAILADSGLVTSAVSYVF